MSKIPTAEEFLKSKDYNLGGNEELADGVLTNNVIEDMIEFAKLHVEQALEAAFNNSEMRVSENDTSETPSFTDNYDDGYVTITVSKNSIINAYPLDLIK